MGSCCCSGRHAAVMCVVARSTPTLIISCVRQTARQAGLHLSRALACQGTDTGRTTGYTLRPYGVVLLVC